MHKFLKIIAWVLLAVLCYFPLFLHLDMPPIKVWDESLFAMRAYHFAETGAYLENFNAFPGLTHYANLKPPFGTYIQALFFKIFGVSELALRLPTALFALGICYLLLQVSKDLTKSYWAGIISVLVMITTPGFISVHVARTGDQDVMVCFWMLLQLLFFYRYTENQKKENLYLLALVSLIGFLTKSVFAFFWFPAFALFLLTQNKIIAFLRNPHVWYSIAGLFMGVVTYYWLMDSLMDGFFDRVLDTVLGRYTKVIDEHHHPFGYYFERFYQSQFFPWVWVLPLTLFFHFRFYKDRIRSFHTLLWTCLLVHLLVISISKTKLEWYDAPVFALAALIVGLAFRQIWKFLPQKINQNDYLKLFAIGIVFAYPYSQSIQSIYHKKWEYDTDIFAYQMKKLAVEQPALKDYVIYCGPYDGQVGFYSRFWNEKKDFSIKVTDIWKDELMHEGEHVLSCYRAKLEAVNEKYETETVSSYEKCQVLKLGRKKN